MGYGNKSLFKWSGHMTNMAAMPIYTENLLWNQTADDIESWYVALST